MRVVVRGKPDRLRSSAAFSFSGSIHGLVLLSVVFGQVKAPEPAKSIYDQEIRPHQDRIIWYDLRARLPEITPSSNPRDPRPPRAQKKSDHTLVAGTKDDPRHRTMIWSEEPPVPALRPKEPQKLPNLVAVAPSKPLRPFAPPALQLPASSLSVPEPPKVSAPAEPAPYAGATLSPRHRAFTPPVPRKAKSVPVKIPEPPRVALAIPTDVPQYAGPTLPRRYRQFTPPGSAKIKLPAPEVPEPPKVAGAVSSAKMSFEAASLPRATRGFAPPAQPEPHSPAPALPDAPAPGRMAGIPDIEAAPSAPARRGFTQPAARRRVPASVALPDAPEIAEPHPLDDSAQASLAIAGLDPVKSLEIPKPPPPREGGFSIGPEKRAEGGSSGDGKIIVPGLTAREGAKDEHSTLESRAAQDARLRLVAVLHMPLGSLPPPEADSTASRASATRVGGAPDPMLEGRAVYTMAIQMPNVTSYSGSWMVWFAERGESQPGAPVQAPVAVRKVDPKYIVAAADERIEGKVRLSAIIRRDGSVVWVKLLGHLDDRLDRSAMEALAKWEFQPARRDGVPIDVDAIFEIPFHLAPKPRK